MRAPQLAAIVKDDRSDATTVARLERILTFLGIPYEVFEGESHLVEAGLKESLRSQSYAVIAPITALGGLGDECNAAITTTAHSRFLYLTEDISRCSAMLRSFTQSPTAQLISLGEEPTDIKVSEEHPSFTSTMHGLEITLTPGRQDHALQVSTASPVEKIIESKSGVSFFSVQQQGLRTYISCSSAIPDLQRSTNGRAFDVKEEFLSIVPLFIYLKWAFREVCWQPNEHGACLIIDDPVLKTNYGCCDFKQIDSVMREHSFTTNLAFIPWNWRRTSADMAALVRNSEGRFSVAIHGCDHTGGEFGVSDVAALNAKITLARRRMESHQSATGVVHDPVMVFPQGVFSKQSLRVLQQHQFVAAVNTKVLPVNGALDDLTVEDVCRAAILKYGAFPLFTRRYPKDGIENFAFDSLLGKPCLIVEHHNFFVDNGKHAIAFIEKIKSLNCPLRWSSLGEVIKRSYHWRRESDARIRIRMTANEIDIATAGRNGSYQIEKIDTGSAGVTEVLLNGASAPWHRDNGSLIIPCSMPASGRLNVAVHYREMEGQSKARTGYKVAIKIAARRYLSEFRDNFLCRHERLMSIAQKAKRFVMPPPPTISGRHSAFTTARSSIKPSAKIEAKTILLISTKVPHYRVSIYNYLHRRFLEHGWEFKVASDGMQAQNELVVKFDFRRIPFRFSQYRKVIDELKPDVVIFHLLIKDLIFWQLMHWVKLKQIPVVAWTKGANLDCPEDKLRYHIFNYFHRLSGALILYSSKQLAYIKPRNRRKVFVANNTVNFEDYPDIPESKEEIKKELGIPFQKFVLFVGTMGVDGDRKKAGHIIQVFRELDRLDLGLVLAGGGMNDNLKAQLNPRNSLFFGQIHDPGNIRISKLFKAADLFVIPGHVGLGLNQAFYWGLPVVTESGMHPPEIQYLKSGSNGFMVKENDLGELKEKILYLIDNDAVRAEFSRRARADILREASIGGMFASFHNAVDFACAAKNGGQARQLEPVSTIPND